MKAIRVNEHGGPEVLSYEDVPVPEPGQGEARIRLAASGVNYIDTYQRTGLYPRELPLTLGLEGAGEVEAVGEGVEEVAEGDYVAFAGIPGAYAEYIAVSSKMLIHKPHALSWEQAAAVPETNIVMIDLREPRLEPAALLAALERRGVRMVQFGPRRLRAVTHLDVDDAGIQQASDAVSDAVGELLA